MRFWLHFVYDDFLLFNSILSKHVTDFIRLQSNIAHKFFNNNQYVYINLYVHDMHVWLLQLYLLRNHYFQITPSFKGLSSRDDIFFLLSSAMLKSDSSFFLNRHATEHRAGNIGTALVRASRVNLYSVFYL